MGASGPSGESRRSCPRTPLRRELSALPDGQQACELPPHGNTSVAQTVRDAIGGGFGWASAFVRACVSQSKGHLRVRDEAAQFG